MLAAIDKEYSFSELELGYVKENIEDVIDEILNDKIPFKHKESSTFCKFCY